MARAGLGVSREVGCVEFPGVGACRLAMRAPCCLAAAAASLINVYKRFGVALWKPSKRCMTSCAQHRNNVGPMAALSRCCKASAWLSDMERRCKPASSMMLQQAGVLACGHSLAHAPRPDCFGVGREGCSAMVASLTRAIAARVGKTHRSKQRCGWPCPGWQCLHQNDSDRHRRQDQGWW